ncbi:Tad domain-containing protein [Anaerovorax odorimutans]|uniref:Tad domain-containing protein n=1 Tax=Anaerovorax odorimutans TaxID=109327 RepID=UPI000427FCFA|nr:Tad domain-containing protein [Anaerovorax odorimutans]
MYNFCTNKFSKERGSVSIIVAISLTILMAFTAIVLDVGRITLEKQALQNALDAAVLAGAQELPQNTYTAQQIAITYFEQNGYPQENIQQVEFLNSNKVIRISAIQPVEYTFAKVFNKGDNTTVTLSASAQKSSVLDAFNYTLFSGSDMDLLQFKGKNIITGNVHSNNSIKNAAEIFGFATAVNTIDPKVYASEGKIEGSAFIDMPSFSDVTNISNSIDQNTLINVYGATYTANKNEYSMSDGQLNNLLSMYPNLIIDGNLIINGSGVNSTGSIITTGNIIFNGSDVNMTSSNSVCFCSLNGDITFNGGSGNVNGILYTPYGTITLNGSGGTFYGCIIGDLVTCDGGINLTYNSQVVNSLPLTITRLIE